MQLSLFKKSLVAFVLILVWKTVWDFIAINPDASVRAFGDIWDLRTYYNNGKWFSYGLIPYLDVYSEYPQVATYLFGWVHWFSKDAERISIGRDIYFHTFSLLMLGFAYLNFLFVSVMRENKAWLALLLFLPGPLYYTLFRFDALPAFLCLMAIFLVRFKKWNAAALILGVATFTKWYAVLILPAFLTHIWTVEKKIPWRPVLVYLFACLLIILPTFLAVGVDLLIAPYKYHSGRTIGVASLPGILLSLSEGRISALVLVYLFLVLAIISSGVSFFVAIRSSEQFELWVAIILGFFIIFSRIFSPQWILWVLPSLILLSRNTTDVFLVILYGIFTYLAFPLAYDLTPLQLPLVNMLSLLCLGILLVRLSMRLEWQFAFPSLLKSRLRREEHY